MVESVKITLLLCLTGISSCILFLSYEEYTNRYALVTTQSNVVYIFDKKTVTLNKCENGRCEIIHTNFPTDRLPSARSGQAVQVNGSNLIENTPKAPTSVMTTSVNTPVTGAQTGINSQNGAINATAQPKVNSFLNAGNQLPTLQNSLSSANVQQSNLRQTNSLGNNQLPAMQAYQA